MEPTRRQVVQMLAAMGLGGAAVTALAAQARRALDASDLKGALAILGTDMPEDEIEVIRLALQRNLDRFQAVRDFDMDDGTAPAVTFVPRSS